jgi:hypothetical protein
MKNTYMAAIGRHFLCQRGDVDTVKFVTPQGAVIKEIPR